MLLVLEERIIAHGRRIGAQLRQTTKQQGTLQQNVNKANLLRLKGFRLDKKGRDDAHHHPDIGGNGALDALSCYDTHGVILGLFLLSLRPLLRLKIQVVLVIRTFSLILGKLLVSLDYQLIIPILFLQVLK